MASVGQKQGKIKVVGSLNKRQFEELLEVVKDPFFFSTFIWVVNPKTGRVKFDLYAYQKSVLWNFIHRRFNIILKFRQAGITELISLYCLWLAMYHPNKNIQIISIKDRVAKKVLKKIKYMYKNLPEHLQVPIVNGRSGEYGTATDMEFANGSLISSIPTTEEAGRSEGISLLVIDEAAIIRWANTIWASAFPTLSTGGSCILNSTPYGIGNFFHKTWVDACAGGNDFFPIRLKWQMHPDRDINWYNEQRRALGARRTAQEIDGSFLTSGYSVFDLVQIKAIEDMLSTYDVLETDYNGSLLVFEKPKPWEQYAIGADVSTGRSRDYSSFTIMDRHGDEKAVFKGKLSTRQFRDLLAKKGKQYNNALIGPETNDIGEAVTAGLQDNGYTNLYYHEKIVREKGKSKGKIEKIPGWLTTQKNRPIIIDGLEQDIRNDQVTIKDPFFVQEAYTFIYNEDNKPIAMGKDRKGADAEDDDQTFSDDDILGKSITNYIRKGKLKQITVSPR